MTIAKAKLSKLKWWVIENIFVLPVKIIFENIYRPIRVRVLQSVVSIGKLDYLRKEIIMDIKSVSQLSRLDSCKKEPSTIDWLLRDLRVDDVLFDIGANVGAYSLVAAASEVENISIYSFEPSPSTFASLCKNIALNNFGGKIFPLQIALGAKTEITNFYLSSNVAGSAEHALGQPIDMYGNRFTPVEIQTIISFKIDQLIHFFGIKHPTHIKIDVDGFELNVLEGAVEVLSPSRLRHILVEVREDSDECKSILNLLISFKFYLVRKGYATTDGFANYEFERL